MYTFTLLIVNELTFIYFPFIKSQENGQEVPIEQETLNHFCLKEKAVNHIIHHLTKK